MNLARASQSVDPPVRARRQSLALVAQISQLSKILLREMADSSDATLAISIFYLVVQKLKVSLFSVSLVVTQRGLSPLFQLNFQFWCVLQILFSIVLARPSIFAWVVLRHTQRTADHCEKIAQFSITHGREGSAAKVKKQGSGSDAKINSLNSQ